VNTCPVCGAAGFEDGDELYDHLVDEHDQLDLAKTVMRLARATGNPPPGQTHRYLSTGCLHGDHGYCQNNTGAAGSKIPAQCKFCAAPCVCSCHVEGSR
jgi:hypothetical protein